MFIICLIMCIVSTLIFLVSSAVYITCMGMLKILENIEEVVCNEKRKSVSITNKKLFKD